MNPNYSNAKLILAALILTASTARAAGTTGGTTLIEPASARASAMGEAFTAIQDDVAGLGYNPASLESLRSRHLSLMYEKGLADDSYGHFMFGSPMKHGSLGLSVGYYNGGSIDIYDGTTDRTVNAKTDLTAALGYAMSMGSLSLGVTGKYISSELIEESKATAFVGDFGAQMPVGSRVHVGAAIQNIGSDLKYVNDSTSLPQIARLGMGLSLFQNFKTTLLLDAPYYIKDKEQRLGAGVETLVGPMAFRAGYQSGNELASLTFGAGFLIGGMSIDYSYGLVQDLDDSHHVSLGMRFGAENVALQPMVQAMPAESSSAKATEDKPEVTFVQRDQTRPQFQSRSREVYVVKPGDTLGKIAREMYGDPQVWKQIYAANQYLLGDNKTLEVGQRIVLP